MTVSRYLHRLCDVLEEKAQDSRNINPHDLLISESNELLDGLKNLFAESNDNEWVRLMTIAPKQWDRQKNQKMLFSSSSALSITKSSFFWSYVSPEFFLLLRLIQNKARLADHSFWEKNEKVLAYPQCLRGNLPSSDATIDVVVKFYCEDGTSRTSSNAKQTILISRQPVAVRFLEMTMLNVYRRFNERFPGVVARSTFHALRPREVKIASTHGTWICYWRFAPILIILIHL